MARERILIIEDEKLIRWSIKKRLEEEGYGVTEAEDGERARALLAGADFDLVLLDYRLPDTNGMDVLKQLRERAPETSVVMMTAYGTVEGAVEALKLGAFDYMTKPVEMESLVVTVHKALETTYLRREVRRLRSERRESHGVMDLIGRSRAMQDVIDMIAKICASQASTVLLEGESGTGKNVVAKAIHYGSARADHPFTNISCSALTETLLESELFGHERGAFTDARTQKKGLLEITDGGTVFLDEIGEITASTQVKLLRFLEDRTFRRVGGTKDISVDVRIIAATNRDLRTAVDGHEFREDLYYRLQVIPIFLPALRERSDDIPLLVDHFLKYFNREMRKNTIEVAPEAMARLTSHSWPGNVRELRNLIERIMILEDKPCIELDDLPRSLLDDRRDRRTGSAAGAERIWTLGSGMTLEDVERQVISQALDQSAHNQVRAAKLLGISRDTLRYRMKKFGLLESPPE